MTDPHGLTAASWARIGRGSVSRQDDSPTVEPTLRLGQIPATAEGDGRRSPEGTTSRDGDHGTTVSAERADLLRTPPKARKTGEADDAHLTLAQCGDSAPACHRPRPEKRVERWEARNWLRANSALSPVRSCGTFAVGKGWVDDLEEAEPPQVKIVVGGTTGVAGVRGLNSCGSAWACPRCAARIASGRAVEVRKAIAGAEQEGLAVLMLTLTGGHGLDWSLAESWDAVAESWRRLTAGRPWARWKAQVGLQGTIRAVETTLSPRAGWHVHIHCLLVVESPLAALEQKQEIFSLWRTRAEARGLAVAAQGQGLELPRAESGILAGYLAKQGQSWDLASEIALGAVKKGHGASRTPFQILAEIVGREDFRTDAYVELRNSWHEWERHSKGRRAMTWSRGLKDRFAVAEQTDEEIASSKDDGEEVFTLTDQAWLEVRESPGLLVDLLRGVEAGDDWGVLGD